MKLLTLLLLFISIECLSQLAPKNIYYFDPIEIKGTEYVIAQSADITKSAEMSIQLVNTLTGEKKSIQLPENVLISTFENLYFPDLKISTLFVVCVVMPSAKSVIQNRLYLLAPDSLKLTEIEVGNRILSHYVTNQKSGTITLFFNDELLVHPQKEKQIMIFDLKNNKWI